MPLFASEIPMTRSRNALPQLDGSLFLTDAGVETDLIFNHGIAISEFAAHTLLPEPEGRAALERYFSGYLALAREMDAGFVLDTVTWKAHRHWAADLGETPDQLKAANADAVALAVELRERAGNPRPVVINAVIGPRGDAYRPDRRIAADEAQRYYAEQLGWLAATEADMVTGLTFNQAGEAVGLVRAAQAAGMPVAISFTTETDGRLPDGQPLREAIEQVDAESGAQAVYFMVNCAHPDHFASALDGEWARRIRGIRANASRRSHAELDEAPELDIGNPAELADQYAELLRRLPWLNVFGACCGGDLRHVTRIAQAVAGEKVPA
jgi:S-methylmethionine-dependent homocysteine/selenocysteine methylase